MKQLVITVIETVERTYVLGEDEVTLEVLRGRMLKGIPERPMRVFGVTPDKPFIALPASMDGKHTEEYATVTGYDATWVDDGFPVHEKAEVGRVWRD